MANDRTVIQRKDVIIQMNDTMPVGPVAVGEGVAAPQDPIQVIRDEEEAIRMIVVNCECGKQYRIACEY